MTTSNSISVKPRGQVGERRMADSLQKVKSGQEALEKPYGILSYKDPSKGNKIRQGFDENQ